MVCMILAARRQPKRITDSRFAPATSFKRFTSSFNFASVESMLSPLFSSTITSFPRRRRLRYCLRQIRRSHRRQNLRRLRPTPPHPLPPPPQPPRRFPPPPMPLNNREASTTPMRCRLRRLRPPSRPFRNQMRRRKAQAARKEIRGNRYPDGEPPPPVAVLSK